MLQNVAEIISRSFPVNWVFKRRLTNIESGFISQPFFLDYHQMARLKVRLKMVLNCIVTWPLLAQGRVSSFVSATALFWSSCHASGSSVIQSKTRDSTQETLVWTVTAWAIPRAIWAAPGGRASWYDQLWRAINNKPFQCSDGRDSPQRRRTAARVEQGDEPCPGQAAVTWLPNPNWQCPQRLPWRYQTSLPKSSRLAQRQMEDSFLLLSAGAPRQSVFIELSCRILIDI